MKRALLFLLSAVAAACGDGPSDPPPPMMCEGVVCSVEGTVCSEGDGMCHCGGDTGPVCIETQACNLVETRCDPVLPDPICGAGTRWSAGTAAFREATSEWGLTGVEGVRLNVADIDGDGYPDLLVRRGGPGSESFAPEGTRRTWLLHNDGMGRFEDVTQASGLLTLRGTPADTEARPSSGAAFGDVDNDGDVDAYMALDTTDDAVSQGETSEIMLNDGTGHFTLGPDSEVRSDGRIDVPAGASFVDYDRDGLLDLWVPQHNFTSGSRLVFMQDRLYRGDGTGAFVEVTDAAGLHTRNWDLISDLNAGLCHTRAWAAAACDLNGDGVTELLSPSYGRAPNHLWQGSRAVDGTVTFANRSVDSGYAYDDNMTWEDNQFARCFCRDNPTAEGCADVPPPTVACMANWNHDQDREPFRLGGNSGSTLCADVDNDGDLDLLTSEIKHWWAGEGADGSELLVNTGETDVRFDRPGDPATGLEADHLGRSDWDEGHMTNAVLDFDNDGWLDVYIGASDYPGNRGLLFHQESPLSFVAVSTTDSFEHNRSHGVVVADFDRDGDLDLIVGHSRARCAATLPNDCYETSQVRFFENLIEGGNFVQIRLVGGEGTNRGAIGARVTVTAGGATQTREVEGGHGHYGAQDDAVLHFGLGAACEAEVTVRWPDAALTEETFTLPAGHRFLMVQGEVPEVAP